MWAVCTHTSENLRGAVLPPLLLPASGSHNREGWLGACALVSSSQKYSEGRGAKGVRQLDRKTDPDRWDRGKEPPSNFVGAVCFVVFFFFFSPLSLITRTDHPALQTKKMPKSSPCVFPWSSLWLASLATLVVQSVLSSSYSSSSTYPRPATGGKRPGFMERTLILLDVNTRSPIRVLNDNFLSLQLDPSIIKDGWLDFLRYQKSVPAYQQHRSVSVSTSKIFGGSFIHYARSHVVWIVMEWASTFPPHSGYWALQCSTVLSDFYGDWQSPNLSDNSIRRHWEWTIGPKAIHFRHCCYSTHCMFLLVYNAQVYFTILIKSSFKVLFFFLKQLKSNFTLHPEPLMLF